MVLSYLLYIPLLLPVLLYVWYIDRKYRTAIKVKFLIPILLYSGLIGLVGGVAPYLNWIVLLGATLLTIFNSSLGSADKVLFFILLIGFPVWLLFATFLIASIIWIFDRFSKLSFNVDNKRVFAPYLVLGFVIVGLLSGVWQVANNYFNPLNASYIYYEYIGSLACPANTINTTYVWMQNGAGSYGCYQEIITRANSSG